MTDHPERWTIGRGVDVVVHEVQHEHWITPLVTSWGERSTSTRHRFVCSCGYATRWYKRWLVARRAMDRHALGGQTSLGI